MEEKTLFKTTNLEKNWFRSFVKRNPRVKLRKSQPLENKGLASRKKIWTPGLMASNFFSLKNIAQISRRKSGTVMRPVSICKGEQGTSLDNLTEKKGGFASFLEAESTLLRYLVLTHVANGCPRISFFEESTFPLLTIR